MSYSDDLHITEEELQVLKYRNEDGLTLRDTAEAMGWSRSQESRVRRIIDKYADVNIDELLVKSYTQLSKRNQRQMDINRVNNKTQRENNRMVNAIEEISESICEVFDKHKLTTSVSKHRSNDNAPVGVIQLSDNHFGEVVDDGIGNKFNTKILSARLMKLMNRSITMFKAHGVTDVLFALTGDMINSDRRLDELLVNSKNRAGILFDAVDIIQQMLRHAATEFNVTVASICGNESRIGKDLGWVDAMASDNFDAMLHNMLSRLFEGSDNIRFIPMKNPLESVIDVNGHNFLLIHGHNGLANTSRMENEVNKVRARYAVQDVRIDYVIAGHIHCSYVSDNFARSSGIVGGNAYSDKALNLNGRAAQNIYIVHTDGIDGIKVDLQNVDEDEGYELSKEPTYRTRSEARGNVIIQSVLI